MSARKARQQVRSSARLAEARRLRIRVDDPKAQEVIDRIYDAFEGVERTANDRWGEDPTYYGPFPVKPSVQKASEACWEELVDDESWHGEIFHWRNQPAENARYYLPPSMIKAIRDGWFGDIDEVLADMRLFEETDHRGSLRLVLDAYQIEAVQSFLRFMVERAVEDDDPRTLNLWAEASTEWQTR